MNERFTDDPEWESMNNFHCHMPGGLYRPTEDPKKGFIPKTMRECLEEFAPFIDLSQDEWPSDCDRELVIAVKTKRDIQREIDKILESRLDLFERWEATKELFRGGGQIPLREFVLRPIYTILRDHFTEEELSS